MGEIVGVDCEKYLKMGRTVEQNGKPEEEEEKKKKNKESESSEVVRWEEYLPNMVISVLLVEADDSTRQTIAALLRKCNYKVVATHDGLKAWEILKQKHNNIDLILTEVDLPLISGFALLTLIMEHDGCKNIPVIMMSSSDSISMVIKCMLKGAADFLIKPVRRNELKNLWHHVWRRISANDGSGVQNLGGCHFQAEAPSTKRAIENCSDDNVFSSSKYTLSTEKANNAQGASISSHSEEQQHQKRMRLEDEIEEEKSTRFEPSGVAHGDEAYTSTLRQAIDLIGTIDNHHNYTPQQPSTNDEPDISSMTQLHLCLRPNGVEKLNHSNASAFSRYSCSNKLSTLNAVSSDEENRSTVISDPASQSVFPGLGIGFTFGLKPTNREESSRRTSPLQSDQGTYGSSLGNSGFDETSSNEEKAAASQSGASGSICQEKDDTNQGNEQFGKERDARHSSYREAALAKFRQKRKDRCYEKKVRYQSRKQLAEQRPRVKGQFVRQVQMNHLPPDTDNCHEGGG